MDLFFSLVGDLNTSKMRCFLLSWIMRKGIHSCCIALYRRAPFSSCECICEMFLLHVLKNSFYLILLECSFTCFELKLLRLIWTSIVRPRRYNNNEILMSRLEHADRSFTFCIEKNIRNWTFEVDVKSLSSLFMWSIYLEKNWGWIKASSHENFRESCAPFIPKVILHTNQSTFV
jgi:hypothetical protein